MDDLSIKKNIAKFRKAAGMTQSGVADRIGISRTAYRNFESGETRIYNENLEKIAAALNKSVQELVLGYDSPEGTGRGVKDGGESQSLKRAKEEIASLRNEVARLNESVEALKGTIRDKEDIIKYQREIIQYLRNHQDQ